MKRSVVLICIILILSLAGCGNSKNEFQIGEKSNFVISEKGVGLSIKEDTLSRSGATLVLKNENDQPVEYGDVSYTLEIKQDGEWHRINVELFFADAAYVLKGNETVELDTKWEEAYGKLAKGEYRIVKDIYTQKSDGTYEKFYVAAEFSMK